MIDDRMFANVPLNTNAQNPCSPPDPGPNWRGIHIQAPANVRVRPGDKVGPLGAFAAVPVCGYYLLDVLDLEKNPTLVLVATDLRTAKVYRGEVVERDAGTQAPAPPPLKRDPKELEGVASGAYFNPNLVDYAGIPRASAVYEVFAEIGGARSNLVTIRVSVP